VPSNQPSPYRDVRFLGYILARGLSMVGDNIWWVAVGWAAAQLGDPSLTGLVLAVTGVPRLFLMLFGGAISDLRGARPVMLISDIAAGVAALAAAGLAFGQERTAAWLLIVMGVVFGTIDSFYLPASRSYLVAILPQESLARGATIRQFTSGLATVGGRSLGGVLVALGGFALGALTNSVSFFICFALLWFVRPRREIPRPPPRTSIRTALADGLRYTARNKLIRGLAVLVLVLNAVTTPITTVGLALRAESAGWGSEGYGLVAACLGVGGLVGSLLGTVFKTPVRAGLGIGLSTLAGALPLLVLAAGSSLPLACAGAALWSLCTGYVSTILAAILVTSTKPEMLGRVQSLVDVLANAVTPVANAAFGLLVGLFGLNGVGIGCVVCFGAAVAWILVSRDIRDARLPSGNEAEIGRSSPFARTY
jgi:MFS family permease